MYSFKKKFIFLYFLFYYNKIIFSNHYVEIYNYRNYNNAYRYCNFSLLNFLFNIGLNDIIKGYKFITKNKKELANKMILIKKIYEDFLVINNLNDSFQDKIKKIFLLIEKSIDNINEKEMILKIYKKILYIFL